MEKEKTKLEDILMSRRKFLQIATAMGINAAVFGCGLHSVVRGELSKVTRGFNPDNSFNPNLKYRHHQIQTFHYNVIEHGRPEWGGVQFHLSDNEKIVSCARGVVEKIQSKNGYHGLEDDVLIDHGGGIASRYFHMKYHSSPCEWRKEINRGNIVGLADGDMPFKASMYRSGILEETDSYGPRILGDPDNYGPRMGYMKYWDGKTHLDLEPEEIDKKSRTQFNLIKIFRNKYVGIGANELHKVNYFSGIPLSLTYDKEGHHFWSHVMAFKLVKYIYDNQPESFKGTKKENDALIEEIYNNQPVVFTLFFTNSK